MSYDDLTIAQLDRFIQDVLIEIRNLEFQLKYPSSKGPSVPEIESRILTLRNQLQVLRNTINAKIQARNAIVANTRAGAKKRREEEQADIRDRALLVVAQESAKTDPEIISQLRQLNKELMESVTPFNPVLQIIGNMRDIHERGYERDIEILNRMKQGRYKNLNFGLFNQALLRYCLELGLINSVKFLLDRREVYITPDTMYDYVSSLLIRYVHLPSRNQRIAILKLLIQKYFTQTPFSAHVSIRNAVVRVLTRDDMIIYRNRPDVECFNLLLTMFTAEHTEDDYWENLMSHFTNVIDQKIFLYFDQFGATNLNHLYEILSTLVNHPLMAESAWAHITFTDFISKMHFEASEGNDAAIIKPFLVKITQLFSNSAHIRQRLIQDHNWTLFITRNPPYHKTDKENIGVQSMKLILDTFDIPINELQDMNFIFDRISSQIVFTDTQDEVYDSDSDIDVWITFLNHPQIYNKFKEHPEIRTAFVLAFVADNWDEMLFDAPFVQEMLSTFETFAVDTASTQFYENLVNIMRGDAE